MNTILFDLDGTLLPMDLEGFLDTYEKALKSRLEHAGFDADLIWQAIWQGMAAMLENEGMLTNEDMFLKTFDSIVGEKSRRVQREIEKFYQRDFSVARLNTQPTPYAEQTISMLKRKGYTVVLATNPVFPAVATEQRIRWAGLEPEDFALITTYENTCYTKPNLNYYRRLLRELNRTPDDCLMVGNDVDEDMCVVKMGMDTFLIKDCLINRSGRDISDFKQGSWQAFAEYAESLPSLKNYGFRR